MSITIQYTKFDCNPDWAIQQCGKQNGNSNPRLTNAICYLRETYFELLSFQRVEVIVKAKKDLIMFSGDNFKAKFFEDSNLWRHTSRYDVTWWDSDWEEREKRYRRERDGPLIASATISGLHLFRTFDQIKGCLIPDLSRIFFVLGQQLKKRSNPEYNSDLGFLSNMSWTNQICLMLIGETLV